MRTSRKKSIRERNAHCLDREERNDKLTEDCSTFRGAGGKPDPRRHAAHESRSPVALKYANGDQEAIHLDIASGSYTTLPGSVWATGVNKWNEVVGSDNVSGLFWSSPTASPIALAPLSGDLTSWAEGINDDGIVIGASESVDEDGNYVALPVVWRVFLDNDDAWRVDGPKALPPLQTVAWWVYDINEVVHGVAQVVGESDGEAVIWTVALNADGTLGSPGFPVAAGTLPAPDSYWSSGYGINNFCDACGQSGTLPFVAPAGQPPQPLTVPRNTFTGQARDINDAGEIVGSADLQLKGNKSPPGKEFAFLWKDGERTDLTGQIPSNSGWDRLRRASVINNSGVVGGAGVFDVPWRGFLLLPNSP